MNTNEFAQILLTWIKSFLSWIGIPRDRLNELDEIIFLILADRIQCLAEDVCGYSAAYYIRLVAVRVRLSFHLVYSQ